MAARIHALDPRIGNNGKRGNLSDISDDALCFWGEGADYVVNSVGTVFPASVIDIIGGAGGPNPTPTWQVVSNANAPIKTGFVAPGSEATPAPVPTYPSYEELGGDLGGVQLTTALEKDYKTAGKPGLDGGCGTWPQRVNYDFLTRVVPTMAASISKHEAEWRQVLNDERVAAGLDPITNW